MTARLAALAIGGVVTAVSALAEGDMTGRAERLEPLVLDAAAGFSWSEARLVTGTYYRWRIESDGREEYRLVAPDLFANARVHQVSIEDREVEPVGLRAVGFDGAGAIDIWFVPLRPGTFAFYVEGLEADGFRGAFTVE